VRHAAPCAVTVPLGEARCDATVAWLLRVLLWADPWLSARCLGGGLYALLVAQTLLQHGAALHPATLFASAALAALLLGTCATHVPWAGAALVRGRCRLLRER